MEQLVARKAHNLEVRGSSPLPATKICFMEFMIVDNKTVVSQGFTSEEAAEKHLMVLVSNEEEFEGKAKIVQVLSTWSF